jgi:hypothetical protein
MGPLHQAIRRVTFVFTYLRCRFTDAEHFDVDCLLKLEVLRHFFVLECWHWKQVLKQKVEQDKSIKLQVAIFLLF